MKSFHILVIVLIVSILLTFYVPNLDLEANSKRLLTPLNNPLPSLNPFIKYAISKGLSREIAERFAYLGDDGLSAKDINFVDTMAEINNLNPKFAEWAFTENLFLYQWVEDGELDVDESLILLHAASLKNLAPYLFRMPEIYEKEVPTEDILNYIGSLRKIMEKDFDAARFVLETGLFMQLDVGMFSRKKEVKFSDTEKEFIDESLGKSDLLRLYVSDFVMNGIQEIPYLSIVIDGKRNEWEGIKSLVKDEKGDNKFDIPGTDIKAIYIARDDEKFYLMLEVYGKLNPQNGYIFRITVEYKEGEYIYYNIDHFNGVAKLHVFVNGKWTDKDVDIKAKDNEVFEVGIPVGLLRDSLRIGVESVIWNSGKEVDTTNLITATTINDFRILRDFNPPKYGDLGYLSDDFEKLPDITDGMNELEGIALKRLTMIVRKSKENYQIRKGVYLIDEYGKPQHNLLPFEVPDYNTQLQCLLWLLEQRDVPEDYYVIALAIALNYGFVLTVGDNEVDEEVKRYIPLILDFIIDTDERLKIYGVNWKAKEYPLEAAIPLVWWAGSCWPPEGKDWQKQADWIYALNKLGRPLNKRDLDWLFTEVDTMKDIQNWVIEEGFLNFTNKSEPFEEHLKYTENYPFCYGEWDGKVLNYLDDFFFYEGERKFAWESNLTEGKNIDGKTMYWETIHNVDWLWNDFKKTGKVRFGSCSVNSFLCSTIARSINIAATPILIQHALPGFYSIKDSVWRTTVYDLRASIGNKKEHISGFMRLFWRNLHYEKVLHHFSQNVVTVYDARKFGSTGMPLGYILRPNFDLFMEY